MPVPSTRDELVQAAEEGDIAAVIRSLDVPVEGDADRALALRILRKARAVDAVPSIVRLLGDDNTFTRGFAARALGEIGISDPEIAAGASAALERVAIEDPVWQVRTWSLTSIGMLGCRGSLAPLIRCSKDENDRVALAAVWAIGRIGDARGLEAVDGAIDRFRLADLNIVGQIRLRLVRRRLRRRNGAGSPQPGRDG